MFEIFKSEFQRYRTWALLATATMLAGFGFIAKLKPFLAPDDAQMALTNLILIVGALAFGFVQMHLHKRQGNWTYLIQRPLSSRQIFTGLALAGAALVGMVVLIPWLVMVIGMDAFTPTVVDARHYGYVLFELMLAYMAYLIGTLAALSPNKGAILFIILFAVILPANPQTDLMQFLPPLLSIAALLALNVVSFKPDLSLRETRPWAITLSVLGMGGALVIAAVMSTTLTYHIPKFIMGTHPDNNPIDGTYSYAWSMDASKWPAYVLEGSEAPRADYYIKQAELADIGWVDTEQASYPRRGQMYVKDASYGLMHEATGTTWQFSHDLMLLVGYNSITGKSAGAVGRNGFLESADDATDGDRFTKVPTLMGDKFIVVPGAIYEVNFDDRVVFPKFELESGEYLLNKPQIGENYVAVVTNKRTLLFDPRILRDVEEAATPDYDVPHPVSASNITFIRTYRITDGYLFLYQGTQLFGFDTPGSVLVHARLGGGAEEIGRRSYSLRRHPAWIRHARMFVSPAMAILNTGVQHLIDPTAPAYAPAGEIIARAYPAQIYWLAGILQLMSAVLAFLFCHRHGFERGRTITWVVLAAIISVPALAALILMSPWRREVQAA